MGFGLVPPCVGREKETDALQMQLLIFQQLNKAQRFLNTSLNSWRISFALLVPQKLQPPSRQRQAPHQSIRPQKRINTELIKQLPDLRIVLLSVRHTTTSFCNQPIKHETEDVELEFVREEREKVEDWSSCACGCS